MATVYRPQPRQQRVEVVVMQELLARHLDCAPPLAYTTLAKQIGLNPGSVSRVVPKLFALGLIQGKTGTGGYIRLTSTGVLRAGWSKILGVRAIVGLPEHLLASLRALATVPRITLTAREIREAKGCEGVTDSEMSRMRDWGLVFDTRDAYADGTNQPHQWCLTSHGLRLLSCLAGDPVPVE